MTTWRNSPRWWRLGFAVVAVTAAVWSLLYPAAGIWAAAVLWLAWEVEAAEQAILGYRAEADDQRDRAEAAEARLRAMQEATTSELRRRLEVRPSAPVVNLYPRLPRDGGEAS